MKNIALFGGSFDPVHLGHTAIVDALKSLDFIDEIVIMPTYLNPLKSGFTADAKTRLQWLMELYENDPKVKVSLYEVKQNKKVATIDTVKHLMEDGKKIYLVIGADSLRSLNKWHKYDKLKKLVTLIVAARDGICVANDLMVLPIDKDISSTRLRQKIDPDLLPPKIAKKIEKFYKEHNAKQN
ncbi:MAG: nicotinate (nicotinamide) nucleotide adenylyltransferase [Epsilonproteobacteria bacterium]|nr:nicotinate (nicotinamide) nucleotide adenylyltransferase [Campylobacterota bacterium]